MLRTQVSVSRLSLRAGLLAGAASTIIAFTATSTAFAAGAAADAAANSVSEVVVTGSNIRGVAPVGSQIVTVDRSEIVASGAVTTAQLLQELPQVTNLGVTDASTGQANGSGNQTRGTSIDLRGLGAFTTLTILDGRRVVPQGTSGQSVDPSIIPTIMLQRVDIEADGASATYGSDAISGVVNLIMRRNVEGIEVTAMGGWGNHYNTHQFDIIGGKKWDGGQITVAAQNQYHGHLSGADRDFFGNNQTGRGGNDFRTTNCTPGNVTFTDPVTKIAYSYAVGANGALTGTGTGPGVVKNQCDPGKLLDLLPSQDHYNVAYTFDQVINDRISLTSEGLYSHRHFDLKGAPGGSTLALPSTNPFYKAPPAGVTAPFCAGSATVTCETVSFNTLGYVPVADTSGFADTYQFNLGLDIKLIGDWKLTPYVTYGLDQEKAVSRTGLAGGPQAPGAAALANGFNPFSSTQPATALNPANPAQAFTNLLFYGPGSVSFGTGNLTLDGTLFTLPGGPVKAAVGYQFQDQRVALGLANGTVQATTVNPVTGFRKGIRRIVNSYFAEVDIPLVGAGNAFPGVKSLDLDAAVREDKYLDTFRGVRGLNVSTTNPKFGINWQPFDDLKIRASYGTSFRAPVFAQEYGNSNQLFVQAYSDANPGPGQGAPGAPINYIALSGPNGSLQPETAKTKSFGADYTPSFVPGLRLNLTYFDINYTGAIANYLSNVTILSSTVQEGLLAGTGVINRNPSDALLTSILQFNPNGSPVLAVAGPFAQNAQFPCFGVAPGQKSNLGGFTGVTCNNYLSGSAAFIDGRNKNLGVTLAKGIDFQAHYHWGTDRFGDFGVGVNGTYFTQFDQSTTPKGTPVNVANTTLNPLRFKYRASADWHMAGYTANVFVNYQNGYHNAVAPVDIPSWTTVDAHFAYSFGDADYMMVTKNVTVALDVTNLFDKDPPFVNISEIAGGGGGGFDPVNANPVGRVVSISLDKKF